MSVGGFALVAIIVVVAVIFLKKKGALGADASTSTSLSDSMTGGGSCPAGSSGLDQLAASGNVTADQITQYCAAHADDCGCTSL